MAATTLLPTSLPRATVEDLLRVEGKAELIGGRIVRIMPSGEEHGVVSLDIARKLAGHLDHNPSGRAYPDNVTFRVPELLSGRETFSPDVAFIAGKRPRGNTGAVEAPPDFAVEVRSENDYGRAAEKELSLKRADYFEAGTQVLWDVDPEAKTITKYSKDGGVTVFGVGLQADAEPAVPGWTLDVAWLFRDA
jgi:Uma2 family endonuclease